jgi:hypothetical protein
MMMVVMLVVVELHGDGAAGFRNRATHDEEKLLGL